MNRVKELESVRRIILKSNSMKLLMAIFGCCLQAIAVTTVLKPNNLVVGGFTGLALVLERIIHLPYTYIYYAACMLILISAYFVLGRSSALKIVVLSLLYPAILLLMSKYTNGFNLLGSQIKDPLLASIYYGIICGIGVGLVMKSGYSQGSSDTVAKILHRKVFPFVSISQILLGIDIVILGISSVMFGHTAILYALLMHFIYSKTIETILYGLGSTKVRVEVITSKKVECTDYIMNTLGCRITLVVVKGGYSGKQQEKLITICTMRESMMIKGYVAQIDKKAFLHIIPIVGAWGQHVVLDSLEIDTV